eukprot:115555-Pyramimonas_sp.AAC.1
MVGSRSSSKCGCGSTIGRRELVLVAVVVVAPYGATARVRGVPGQVRVRHAHPAAGAFGGTSARAAKRVRVVPHRVR